LNLSHWVGQMSALNLDLALDELRGLERTNFIRDIGKILENCRPCFATPVKVWLQSIDKLPLPAQASLKAGLDKLLDGDITPRYLTTKMCDLRLAV
jgi:hypothetical protein